MVGVGDNIEKNYRKPINWHFRNYRQIIDIENDGRFIENLSISKKMTYRPRLSDGGTSWFGQFVSFCEFANYISHSLATILTSAKAQEFCTNMRQGGNILISGGHIQICATDI